MNRSSNLERPRDFLIYGIVLILAVAAQSIHMWRAFSDGDEALAFAYLAWGLYFSGLLLVVIRMALLFGTAPRQLPPVWVDAALQAASVPVAIVTFPGAFGGGVFGLGLVAGLTAAMVVFFAWSMRRRRERQTTLTVGGKEVSL